MNLCRREIRRDKNRRDAAECRKEKSLSLHLSSGIRHSRSPRRLSVRSEPPRVWLPPLPRVDGVCLDPVLLPLRNVWMSEATCAAACELRETPGTSRDFRLALACLTDLYALGLNPAPLPERPQE